MRILDDLLQNLKQGQKIRRSDALYYPNIEPPTITTAIAHFDPALAISLAAANLVFKGVDKAGVLERKMTKRGEMI